MTPEAIALFNLISLLVTIAGAIIGLGFYLEKRAINRMDRIETKIEKSVLELEWSLIDEGKIQTKEEVILPDLREIAEKKFPLRKWN